MRLSLHTPRNNYRYWRALGVGSLALLLAGCVAVSPSKEAEWEPFEDPQEPWPTQTASLMRQVDGFPIYDLNQLPPYAYDVLGILHVFSTASTEKPVAVDEHALARRAREKGGEAALITRQGPPTRLPNSQKTDYLIVKFRTDHLATALERINVFLALTAGNSQGYQGPGPNGETVQYTAEQLAARRAELENERQSILALPRFKNSDSVAPTVKP